MNLPKTELTKMTLDIVVAMELQQIGFYTYPETIKLFKDIFTNNATKEQIDYAETISKSPAIKRGLAKAYDNVQKWIKENSL